MAFETPHEPKNPVDELLALFSITAYKKHDIIGNEKSI